MEHPFSYNNIMSESLVTLPLNLNRFSINCLIKNDNYIEFNFRLSLIFKDWLNTSNIVDMLVAGASMVGR